MGEGGLADIEEMVATAIRGREYFRHKRSYALFRRRSPKDDMERLIDGRWAKVRYPRSFGDSENWKRLDADDLGLHVQRYLIADLDGEAVAWRTDFVDRFRRTAFWRWVMPPLKGGSSKRLGGGAAPRSRSAYAELLSETTEGDLSELKEQALLGYEHQRARGAGTEQRANFFLGAAGLTTSLVLANAGLLLGASKLHSPWRSLAAIALGVASICAIAAGVRALQATMITFFRTPPDTVDRVLDRLAVTGDDLVRFHIAALLVAQGRAGAIGDWKIHRVGGARRWFIGAIASVVLLTIFVLAEAL